MPRSSRSPELASFGPNPANALLGWAGVCLVMAVVAAVFGFGGFAAAAGVAQLLAVVFLAVFAVALTAGLVQRARSQS